MTHINKKTLFLISFGVLVVVSSFMFAQYVDAIAVGNTIRFTADTNIRSCASISCGIITTAPSGSTASIIGGPQYANGYQWWNVRLSSGVTGWAVSNWMTVVSAPAPAPTVNVSVSPTSINLGQSVTFSWSSTNATSCTGSRGGSYPTSGSNVYAPPSLPYTYGMQCTGPGGTSAMQTATVSQKPVAAPPLNFSANPTSINSGQPSTLSWSSSNATSCSASGGWSGGKSISGSESVRPGSTTTYSLSCSGPGGGRASKSVTVTVTQPAGPVACTAQGSSSISKRVGEGFDINWCVSDVSSWSVSGPGLSRSDGAVGNTPRQFSASYPSQFSMSLPSSPNPYVYNITGTGPTGNVTRPMTVTISAVAPLPQYNDGADNDGDGRTDYPSDPGYSSTSDDDETDILPPVINDFWAENDGGSSISGVCNIDADPKILVIPKNTSTLTWSCDRVISGCTLYDDNPKVPDMGAVASSGSEETPAIDATTKFTLQCPSSNDPSVIIRLFSPFLKEIIPQ